MSLLSEALQVSTTPGPQCLIGKLIDDGTLSYDELAEAFASKLDTSVFGKILRGRGHRITDQQLRMHRRGECAGCHAKGRFTS